MKLKFLANGVVADNTLGDRQIRVVASDATPDRDGDVMVAEGCNLVEYQKNPICLANHDPALPIGNARVTINMGKVLALITFAPPNVSETADTYCRLTKAGVLRAVSVGFSPLKREPRKGGGYRITEWTLLEISIVSVPSNPAALVVERASKVGRVISSANAERLREAHDHADAARSIIHGMLDDGGQDEELSAARAARMRRVRAMELEQSIEPSAEREKARAARLRQLRVIELEVQST